MIKENKIAVIGLSGESIFMKVDHFHHDGETVVADVFHKEYGGKGYNQAVACKRFGADVSFLTVIGDDQIGEEVIKSLEKENINGTFIKKNNSKSAYATILIDKIGNNQVTCFPGVSKNLTKEDVLLFEKEIATSKILLLQMEMSDESLFEAISIAKKYDTLVILNPAPAHQIPNEILKQCDIITPNENECEVLFNISSNYQTNLLKLEQQNVIVTLGSKGSIVKDGDVVYEIEPLKVNPLNTTGAGDTYNGVLAACILEGFSLKKACIYANFAASISVTKEFVIDSIPYRLEIESKVIDFYKKNNVKLEEEN